MFGIYSKESGIVEGPFADRASADLARNAYVNSDRLTVDPYDQERDDAPRLIAPGCSVWESSIETIGQNGMKGDYEVTLNVGTRTDGRGQEPFLQTNGGPRLITVEGGSYACSIVEAAETLEMEPNELIAIVREFVDAIEWPESIDVSWHCDECGADAKVDCACVRVG